MSIDALVIGVLTGLLIAAGVQAFVARRAYRADVRVALAHETVALDRARAAELRSAQQIDALLDRIGTTPRLEVAPAEHHEAPSPEPQYISDLPYMDGAWNEYTGAIADDEVSQ